MDIIREKLEEELCAELDRLASLTANAQDTNDAIDNLVALYKLKLEEDKLSLEQAEKERNREIDEKLKAQQIKESVKDRYFRTGIAVAELVLPLAFYGVWLGLGFKFEEENTFTSKVFQSLYNRFRPVNK